MQVRSCLLMALLLLVGCERGTSPNERVVDLSRAGEVAVALGGDEIDRSQEYCARLKTSESRHALDSRIANGLVPYSADMGDDINKLYQEMYTKDELDYLKKFYSSAIGQNIARKNLELNSRLAEIGYTYEMAALTDTPPEPRFPCTPPQ